LGCSGSFGHRLCGPLPVGAWGADDELFSETRDRGVRERFQVKRGQRTLALKTLPSDSGEQVLWSGSTRLRRIWPGRGPGTRWQYRTGGAAWDAQTAVRLPQDGRWRPGGPRRALGDGSAPYRAAGLRGAEVGMARPARQGFAHSHPVFHAAFSWPLPTWHGAMGQPWGVAQSRYVGLRTGASPTAPLQDAMGGCRP